MVPASTATLTLHGLPEILCLHGWRSNNDVTKVHAQHLHLQRTFAGGVDCLHGTVPAPGAADQATSDFFEGPFFSWVDMGAGEAEQEAQLLEALQAVLRHVELHGPYDCAYGFSQGGALVTLLSIPAVLQKLQAPGPLWRSAIIACGSGVELLKVAERALRVSIPPPAAALPSLHLIGADDVHKANSEQLAQLFSLTLPAASGNPGSTRPLDGRALLARHIVYFSGGHGVPQTLGRDAEFHAELDAWLARRLEVQVPSAWAPNRSLKRSIARFLSQNSHSGPDRFSERPAHRLRSQNSRLSRSLSSGGGSARQKAGDFDAAERGALVSIASTASGAGGGPNVGPAVPTTLDTLDGLASAAAVAEAAGGGTLRLLPTARSIVLCDPSEGSSWQRSIPDMLACAPRGAPFLRSPSAAGAAGAALTYGALLDFMRPGGPADLRRAGLLHAQQVVLYAAPPGPAGAVALLSVGAQCAAALLDPAAPEDDVVDALRHLQPAAMLAFRGVTPAPFEAAAARVGVPVWWQVLDESAAGLYRPEEGLAQGSLPEGVPPLTNDADGVALLLRTSGSTAKPKVCCITAPVTPAEPVRGRHFGPHAAEPMSCLLQ